MNLALTETTHLILCGLIVAFIVIVVVGTGVLINRTSQPPKDKWWEE